MGLALTVAGETLVACVKFGVASESMFDLPISFCWDGGAPVDVLDEDDEFDAPWPWIKLTSWWNEIEILEYFNILIQ